MKPYTLADAENDLAAALAAGDDDEIHRCARLVDQLDTTPHRALPGLHASALWYAQHGFHIFPLTPMSKVPMPRSRGFKDATTDPDQITTWWTATPDANIGIATGHLVDVVDIDGPTGQASRAHNWPMFEALHVVGKVLTPRPGGMHLMVPAAGVGNKAGLLPGVDYRGLGGYVVAPPSITDQGSYRWLAPIDIATMKERAA